MKTEKKYKHKIMFIYQYDHVEHTLMLLYTSRLTHINTIYTYWDLNVRV
jgi:hypothetical protein